ncbi:MAG TPA: YdcF family protein [Streptosporangiaceae bacterium]
MADQDISAEQVRTITALVDIEAPPSDERPTAHIIFGTNQAKPAEIVAERYHRGLAPLIIVTGGVNRHNGITEGREFHRLLAERGVPDTAIRVEDQSANTWQNVEFALPFLREALDSGLPITAVCKWYHRRAVHSLKTLVHDIGPFYVITWVPSYGGRLVTRTDWPVIPDGKRRVVREWEEVLRRVSEGSFKEASRDDGAWR